MRFRLPLCLLFVHSLAVPAVASTESIAQLVVERHFVGRPHFVGPVAMRTIWRWRPAWSLNGFRCRRPYWQCLRFDSVAFAFAFAIAFAVSPCSHIRSRAIHRPWLLGRLVAAAVDDLAAANSIAASRRATNTCRPVNDAPWNRCRLTKSMRSTRSDRSPNPVYCGTFASGQTI